MIFSGVKLSPVAFEEYQYCKLPEITGSGG